MLTINSIIELLKREGANTKRQVIDLLSNLDARKLYELKHDIECLLRKQLEIEQETLTSNQKCMIKFKGIELKKGTFIRKDFDDYFVLYDLNFKVIYYEDSSGEWCKYKYDSKGNETYYEDSSGDWWRYKYDSKGNCIYYENSKGEKWEAEYDS